MRKRNNELDLLKLFFTIIVFLVHAQYVVGSDKTPALVPKGFLSVEFFFMVSGYFMALSASRGTISEKGLFVENIRFNLDKISKFYPQYLIAFLIAFFLRNLVAMENSLSETLFNGLFTSGEVFLQAAAGIPHRRYYYNGPTWYLSAMVLAMFVLYPMARKNPKRFNTYIAPILVLLGYSNLANFFENYSITCGEWIYFLDGGLLRGIAGISLGCVLFQICQAIRESSYELSTPGRVLATVAEVALLALIVYLMVAAKGLKNYKLAVDYLIIVSMAVLLLIVFTKSSYFSQIIGDGIGRFSAWISLPIYLNHRVWTYVLATVTPELTFRQNFLLYTGLTLVTALISIPLSKGLVLLWHLAKRIFLRKKEAVEA